MTRIVRLEQIDGKLVFQVPDDVAAALKFAAGGAAMLTTAGDTMTLAPLDERKRHQLELGLQIIEEHDEALAALAR